MIFEASGESILFHQIFYAYAVNKGTAEDIRAFFIISFVFTFYLWGYIYLVFSPKGTLLMRNDLTVVEQRG